jgi:hypothetical protein
LIRTRRRGDRQDGSREVLDRAVAELRRCQREGITAVHVAEVLGLLGADPETGPPPMAQYLDPQADPLTGCKPVKAG